MAYATLAGLPEVYGLYIAFVPVFVVALWGSSRQLGTGPVTVVSTMTASILPPVVISMLAPGYTQEEFMALFIPTAMFLTLLVGLFQFSPGLFRLGAIDSLHTSLVADNVTRNQHKLDRELIGQGIGNTIAGLFGGLPGAGQQCEPC